ncbi:plant UBX domain-containing protein 2 [Tanacetum coccineum]
MDAFATLTANVSAYCIMAAFETIKKSFQSYDVVHYFKFQEIASAYWKLLFLYYTFDCYDIRLATCGWTILALEKAHVVLRDAAEAMEVDKPAAVPTISFERTRVGEHDREAEMRRTKLAVVPKSFKGKPAKAARKRHEITFLKIQFAYGVVLQPFFNSQEPTTTLYEIITRKKDGKSRGYAFVTMASTEEALSAIEKYDSHEWLNFLSPLVCLHNFLTVSVKPSIWTRLNDELVGLLDELVGLCDGDNGNVAVAGRNGVVELMCEVCGRSGGMRVRCDSQDPALVGSILN